MGSTSNILSDTELASWRSTGFLHLRGWLMGDELNTLIAATDELSELPETPGKWMKYFEDAEGTRQLCRIENFLQFNTCFRDLTVGTRTMKLMELLMAEPASIFKEKINFKLAGGQGFEAHQDAPAFTTFGQHYHITMMVSIDASHAGNGCLEIGSGDLEKFDTLLPMTSAKTISSEMIEQLSWQSITTEPGDVVFFDSYLPHRSGVNRSSSSRRALYATYNRASEGSCRDEYFAAKRAAFPPDIEREKNKRYDSGVFNIGNPVAELEK